MKSGYHLQHAQLTQRVTYVFRNLQQKVNKYQIRDFANIWSITSNIVLIRDSRWMSYETAAILNQNLPYIPHIIG